MCWLWISECRYCTQMLMCIFKIPWCCFWRTDITFIIINSCWDTQLMLCNSPHIVICMLDCLSIRRLTDQIRYGRKTWVFSSTCVPFTPIASSAVMYVHWLYTVSGKVREQEIGLDTFPSYAEAKKMISVTLIIHRCLYWGYLKGLFFSSHLTQSV